MIFSIRFQLCFEVLEDKRVIACCGGHLDTVQTE